METTMEWKTWGTHIPAPQSWDFGLGISAPDPPQSVVWEWEGAQKCFILRDKTTGDLKSHHLQALVIFTTQYSASTGVNELWDTLKHFTLSFLKDKVPSKMTSSRISQPWINKKVKRISRRKKRVHKRAKQSCSISDLQRYRQLQKESQYECKKGLRQLRRRHLDK